ncbi:MAG: SEC-C metal-binding domain-containing protein [Vicinamibacterales bacterium]
MPGRNDACPCGSGKKYKRCCQLKKSGAMSSRLILLAVAGAVLAVILAALGNARNSASGRVWSAEHGHYHDASGREMAR